MKSIAFFFFLLATTVTAQQVKMVPVKNDKNVMPLMTTIHINGIGESVYVVDGDESQGYVVMTFQGLSSGNKAPSAVSLIINSPDIEWSESPDGYSVYAGTTKLGSISNVGRNTSHEIPLDPIFFNGKDDVTLTVKANGNDGGYIQPNITGFGPVLKMVW